MESFLFYFLKPIKVLVLLTLLFAISRLNWKNQTHRYVLSLLLVCFFTELFNSILKSKEQSTNLVTSLSIIIHHSLWLLILERFVIVKKTARILLYCFIAFAVINLFFMEGTDGFDYYTFVIGAFLYILIFIYDSFYKLKKEDFPFFLSNNYLLLLAPVLFFFGLSFMFGFKSKSITSFIIFGDVKLYTFIIYFVNIVYYALINLYLYREKKIKNE
ncbi:hypothetical protein [Flavobacterium sp.]|uniref:hypothetical protein n=1 Tax=Flavobacterium sp. TaxID=239 RepID=UPI003D6C60FC